MFFALQYHVVRSESGVRVLPRTPQHSLALAWADVRTWTPSQWTDRLELARAAMAAGATDLIADSVRIPLQEEVSESAATLNELRGVLNRFREGRAEPADRPSDHAIRSGAVAIAKNTLEQFSLSDSSPADALDLDHEDPAEPQGGLIPMPPEARTAAAAPPDVRSTPRSEAPADPFRSSPAPQAVDSLAAAAARPTPSPAQQQPQSPQPTQVPRTSRFSDADVRNGLAAGAAAVASRLLQDAEDVERQIFGDVSGKSGSPPAPMTASGSRAAAELEKSARQLLEQVQNAAAAKAGITSPAAGTAPTATTPLDSLDAPWIRKPNSSSASTTTSAAPPPTTTGSAVTAAAEDEPGMSFDPFLEAESESAP